VKIRTKARENRGGYDPMAPPPAAEWLALDEPERRRRVEVYHRAAGIEIPNPGAHALIHAVIETQLAQGLAPVRQVLERLLAGGLDRHEALHAIGSVLARRLHAMTQEKTFDSGEYLQGLEALAVEDFKPRPG
jgi:hypothetical protein